MSCANRLISSLESIGDQLWKADLDDPTFEGLQRTVSILSAQVDVHHVLQKGRTLLSSHSKHSVGVVQSRVGKIIDVIFDNPDSQNKGKFDKFEERWQQLRLLECATFLFIAVSYTPLEITKLPRIGFEFLTNNASKFLSCNAFHPKWMFHQGIASAITKRADLAGTATLWKEYFALNVGVEESRATAIAVATPHLETAQTSRQIDYVFSNGPLDHIPLIGEVFYDAVKTSKQWVEERARGESTTQCFSILIPKGENVDISITLWIGQEAGLEMLENFMLQPTWSATPKHL